MCEFAEFQCFSLNKKRSQEVAWALKLSVSISYSYIVQERINVENTLKRGCNGNRNFSCFWFKMKEFFVSTKCNQFDRKKSNYFLSY